MNTLGGPWLAVTVARSLSITSGVIVAAWPVPKPITARSARLAGRS